MKLLLCKTTIRCLTALTLLTGTVMAQPQTDNTLMAKSFDERLKAAQRGHAESQVMIGLAYQVNYMGVEQNFKESARWFRLAANQGHPLGQNFLAKSYLYGIGVEQNLKQAMDRFKAAAEQGESEAQFMLASIYLNLFGYDDTPSNPVEAYKWLNRSAKQSYVPAFSVLASLYEEGSGVTKDLSAARNWYKKSCDKGVYASCEHVRKLTNELRATTEEIEEAEINESTTEEVDVINDAQN